MLIFVNVIYYQSVSLKNRSVMKDNPFVPGKDKVYYSWAVFGEEERAAVLECLVRGWLGAGEYARSFEERVTRIFGQNFGVFVNSGSSANLLGISALRLPLGGEVITPACTFATTVNPIIQTGLVPVFVDVELDTYNINLDLVEGAITSKTVALMIPHLIGNLNDMRILKRIADKYDLKLIEDSCDTIGGTIGGEPTGRYTDVSTTSFYASHMITAMGGGGMVMFKDESQAKIARTMRGWGRSASGYSDEDPDIRFSHCLNGVPYDSNFVFREIGFNFLPLEVQAAFGLVQLSRLSEFHAIRKRNFEVLYEFFAGFPEHFLLPRQQAPNVDVHWLAFPITILKTSPIQRIHFMRFLEKNKIQTRALFSGNILRHPPYRNIKHCVFGKLTNSDTILSQSLLIGCHHGLRDEHLDYMKQVVEDYLRLV